MTPSERDLQSLYAFGLAIAVLLFVTVHVLSGFVGELWRMLAWQDASLAALQDAVSRAREGLPNPDKKEPDAPA